MANISKSNISTIVLVSIVGICCVLFCDGRPLSKKEPRQLNISQRPDGTVVASFSAAQSLNTPGGDNSFGVSQTYEFGPRGSSSSGSNSFSSDILGNKMSFANSQAQSQGLFGMSAANAAASSFSNPLFSGGNANANAFGSQFG